jgi:N-acetylglucosamine transport system substrate-binding protein
MTHSHTPRAALAGALVAAALVLAGCATPGGGGGATSTPPPPPTPTTTGDTDTAANAFGLDPTAPIDAVIFNGGYKTDYVDYAADIVMTNFPDVKITVSASTQIAQELQPRFVAGNPPDLIDNQGANSIPMSSIIDQLAPLDDLWAATTDEGITVSDAVYPAAITTGTYNGKQVAVPYVMTVYSLWYSQSLFDTNGWTPPQTWDEMMTLCEQAKAQDLYCFVFGKEAASYWQWALLDSAIKSGGLDVINKVANLEPGAWSDPSIQGVLTKMYDAVQKGYFNPGGAGTQFTQAQAIWSNDQKALFYESGSWIENEMKEATADNFQMTAWPNPTLTADSALPFESLQAGASEVFVVPAQAKNVAGGKEVLRTMLSKDAASNFSKTRLAPTIVKDTVPADGYGSTALASAMALIENAGDNTWSYASGGFTTYYAMGNDLLAAWNSFLSGELDVAQMTSTLQGISDKAANDPAVTKVAYEFGS